MRTVRAWSLLAMGEDRKYAGNNGYDDHLEAVYCYDSQVPNHLNVKQGDLALIRDAGNLLGLAIIQAVRSRRGPKDTQRCPTCGTTKLKPRTHKLPKYRCNNGHEFERPRNKTLQVDKFEAHYADTFVKVPDSVPASAVKLAAYRPSNQMSIEEIDIAKFISKRCASFPKTQLAITALTQNLQLSDEEAAESGQEQSEDTEGDQGIYMQSTADLRQSVLKSIKQRRGQRRFRDALIRRYGAKCLVSGCKLLTVIDAAHIWPWRGEVDNHPDNGLLLRTDLHTLYDLHLMAVHPETLTVHVAPHIAKLPEYSIYESKRLHINTQCRPATPPLAHRWEIFQSRWTSARPKR